MAELTSGAGLREHGLSVLCWIDHERKVSWRLCALAEARDCGRRQWKRGGRFSLQQDCVAGAEARSLFFLMRRFDSVNRPGSRKSRMGQALRWSGYAELSEESVRQGMQLAEEVWESDGRVRGADKPGWQWLVCCGKVPRLLGHAYRNVLLIPRNCSVGGAVPGSAVTEGLAGSGGSSA